MQRRDFLKHSVLLGLGGVAACQEGPLSPAANLLTPPAPTVPAPLPSAEPLPVLADSPFVFGVASGDPLADRAIFWTQISGLPEDFSRPVPVQLKVFADEALSQPVVQREGLAKLEDDYTVKLDQAGLVPGTRYWYRFTALGHDSPVGRTRTLPVGALDELKLAVTTCGAYDGGLFNTYAAIAQSDVAAVLHLGDYIYEGIGPDTNALGRVHQPRKRTVTVEEYRIRYRQYRADPDLQALHAAHPMISIWDDHELANNTFTDGAEGHKVEDGDWTERKAAATKVFHEWLPIRTHASGDRERIWREFAFGDLVQLAMLETRITGKSPPAIGAGVDDPNRTLIGPDQREWLFAQLQAPTLWKVIGQQTQMAPMNYVTLPEAIGGELDATVVIGANGVPINYDAWDGYAAERRRLYDFIGSEGVQNVVVLTGDNHYAFAADLIPDTINPLNTPVAVEFGTTAASSSVSGANSNDDLLRRANPWIRYFEPTRNGWTELAIGRDRCIARYYAIATKQTPSTEHTLMGEQQVRAGANRLG